MCKAMQLLMNLQNAEVSICMSAKYDIEKYS